jgi:hypothetical protein
MRDSIEEKSRNRIKYSDINLIENNKNYPSLLRSYCEMRRIDYHRYDA